MVMSDIGHLFVGGMVVPMMKLPVYIQGARRACRRSLSVVMPTV